MMIKLFRKVRRVMFDELEQARKDNGKFFHSVHEGFGVIYEEVEEAQTEALAVITARHLLTEPIRKNNTIELDACCKQLERRAALAACEYIQVAAMARKMRESVRREARAKRWKEKQSTTQADSTPS